MFARRSLAALALGLAGAVAVVAGGTLSPPPILSRLAPPRRPPDTVTIMTFNIGKATQGTGGKYDLASVAAVIARLAPDVVGVQEVVRNDARLDCDDQPARLAELLKDLTGRTWSHVYAQEWFTQDRACAESGRGDGSQTEGLAIFSPGPVGEVMETALYNGRIALAARPATAGHAAVVVTHLANAARNQDDRVRQIAQLLPWAVALGMPRWLIGDLNARPGADELQPFVDSYRDAWTDAVASGTARGAAAGATHGTSRIDYIFYAPVPGVRVVSAEVVDTTALVGRTVSDHAPLIATFQLP